MCVQVCWAIPHPPPGWLTADTVDSIVYVASWPRCQTLQDWRQSWFVPRTFGVASQHVWKLWFVIGILTRIGCELMEEFNPTQGDSRKRKCITSYHVTMSLYVVISRNKKSIFHFSCLTPQVNLEGKTCAVGCKALALPLLLLFFLLSLVSLLLSLLLLVSWSWLFLLQLFFEYCCSSYC